MYERLEAAPVRATAATLEARMAARFAARGLVRVGHELVDLIDDVAAGASRIRGRLRAARIVSLIAIAAVVVATVVLLVFAFRDASHPGSVARSFDWLLLTETTINDVVFAAIAIFFLHSLPNRLERGHTLRLLHRLRSLAHVVDMHQLTKDPERLRPDFVTTDQSPVVGLDRWEMEHYLNYCSELLSLVGKAAALCAESSQDPVVLDTVSTIENLTTSLSRKIWQKISLLP